MFYKLLNLCNQTIIKTTDQVQIFDALEYPDTPTGGCSEKFITPGTEAFIRIIPDTLETESSVSSYSADKRQCLFKDDLRNQFFGRYQRSDCILSCRIRSIIALCSCIPYQYPWGNFAANLDVQEKPIFCTLQHVPCLAKYKSKFYDSTANFKNSTLYLKTSR